MRISANRLGIVLGLVVALWHAIWSALVAAGLAQLLINFIFWAHFIAPVFKVGAFDPFRAVVLVVCTGVVAYAGGLAAGLVWNVLHPRAGA
jgi:hypothetical protein